MNDLKKVIETSIEILGSIQNNLKQVLQSQDEAYKKQFINTCETWEKRCDLKLELSDAIFLIDCIKEQYDKLQQLQRSCPGSMINPDTHDSFEQKRRFKIESTLAITTYLTITWSLYDKLSNVIGRLLGGDNALKNPLSKENPKLIGTFIGYQQNDKSNENKKIISTMGINNIVGNHFSKCICLSYLLRNCFVHEGGTIGKTPIFTEEPINDVFDISDGVAMSLNHEIESSYSIKESTIATAGNLINQLKHCHHKIDKCFTGLLKFAVGSFRIQVEAFLPLVQDSYNES